MKLSILVVSLVLLFGTILTSANAPQNRYDAENRPRIFREGETHRYFFWHDREGWHLRTTTARERHHFEGEITAEGGSIRDLRGYSLEHNDWLKVSQENRRISFDLSTEAGIDGFDFRTDARELRVQLLMDGKERPEHIFIGANSVNPDTLPFVISNPEYRSGAIKVETYGQPAGMGPGSTHRYLLWRDRGNLWHLRTTTTRQRHTFTGEIEAEAGKVFDLRAISAERRDWVSQQGSNKIFFDLTTQGDIDGFDFRTDASELKFRLKLDGVETPQNVYIGERGNNPPEIPFILLAR
jgi:hypothetical protein